MNALPLVVEQTIVVGTDFSPCARNALERALHIARARGATVEIVHTAPRVASATVGLLQRRAPADVDESLHELRSIARKAGVPGRVRVLRGGVARAFRDTASAVGARLVVVGLRHRLLPDGIVGSRGERISSRTHVPVLLVRRHANERYRRVVLGIDEGSDVRKMLDAARFVSQSAKVHLMHVYTPVHEIKLMLNGEGGAALTRYRREVHRETREAMLERLREAGVDECLHLIHGPSFAVLERESRRAETSLLVLNRGRSLARHLLLGSASRTVIAHGTSDVLLV